MSGKGKLVQINTVCVGASTGKIMGNIQRLAETKGWETLSIVGRRKVFPDLPAVRYGTPAGFWLHVFRTCLDDGQGLGSAPATKRMIERLRAEKPDVIILHNLHGYYLNYPMLFRYLKEEHQGKVFWFLHDSWSYTGHCAFYTADCDRFMTECHDCPHTREYPWCFVFEGSRRNFRKKRECFTGMPHLEVITPSAWLAGQVKKSFLSAYPVHVVPNGISLQNFYPDHEGEEETRRRFGIPEGVKVILGVASAWNERKGMEDFRKLAAVLPPAYRIVLVGLNKAQRASMPEPVICTPLVDVNDLRKLYSLSFVLMNASREESFSLVTVEAFACGLPVIGLDNSAVKELIVPGTGLVLHAPGPEQYLEALRSLESGRDRENETVRVMRATSYTHEAQAEKILRLAGD